MKEAVVVSHKQSTRCAIEDIGQKEAAVVSHSLSSFYPARYRGPIDIKFSARYK
jgi:hypothetical protein